MQQKKTKKKAREHNKNKFGFAAVDEEGKGRLDPLLVIKNKTKTKPAPQEEGGAIKKNKKGEKSPSAYLHPLVRPPPAAPSTWLHRKHTLKHVHSAIRQSV